MKNVKTQEQLERERRYAALEECGECDYPLNNLFETVIGQKIERKLFKLCLKCSKTYYLENM